MRDSARIRYRCSALGWSLQLAVILMVLGQGGLAHGQDTPRAGGVLRVALPTEPITLNPGISNSQFDYFVTAKIYESLVYVDEKLNAVPGLAESWTPGADGRSWTLTLRRNVKWHDGKPFTAADVKFTIEQVLLPFQPLGRTNLAGLESVETPSPHTVVLRMKSTNVLLAPPFVALNAFSAQILPKHVFEGSDIKNHRANTAPVGTGPFKLKEWVRGSHIILTKNEAYWQKDRPHLNEVVIRFIPDSSARLLSLEKGEVDHLPYGVSLAAVARFEKTPGIRVERFRDARYLIHGLYFNLRRAPFDKLRVRQAIAHAIDKDAVVRTVTFGLDRTAKTPQPAASPFHNPNVPTYPLSFEKAQELLDQEGLRPGPGGVRFRAVYTVDLGAGETAVKTAELIRDQLRKVGIDITVMPMERAAFLDKVYMKFDFDIGSFFGTMGPDPAIMEKWFATVQKPAAFTNPSGYANEAVDRLFREGAAETSLAKRKQIYSNIQAALARDVPYIVIREDSAPQLVRASFRNVPGDVFAGRADRLADAWTPGAK